MGGQSAVSAFHILAFCTLHLCDTQGMGQAPAQVLAVQRKRLIGAGAA
jgi:hypothetical protein